MTKTIIKIATYSGRGAWRHYTLVQHILGIINVKRPIAAPLLNFFNSLVTGTYGILQLVTRLAVAKIRSL